MVGFDRNLTSLPKSLLHGPIYSMSSGTTKRPGYFEVNLTTNRSGPPWTELPRLLLLLEVAEVLPARDECHDALEQPTEIRDRVMGASGLIFVAPCTSRLAGPVLQPISEPQRPVRSGAP
jgi:hypothetical protein